MTRFALVQGLVQVLQLRGHETPIVKHLLQAVGDARRIMRGAEVTRDHDQLSIASSVFVGGQFHGVAPGWQVLASEAARPNEKLRISKQILLNVIFKPDSIRYSQT